MHVLQQPHDDAACRHARGAAVLGPQGGCMQDPCSLALPRPPPLTCLSDAQLQTLRGGGDAQQPAWVRLLGQLG